MPEAAAGSSMKIKLKKNLDALIVEKLKEQILASRWEPGQTLSPDEIAQQFGVSRTPVVQAIKMMSMEGILNIRSNGRIEIPVFSRKQVIDICKVRVRLEDFAVKTICEQKNDLEIQKLNAIARECAEQIRDHNNIIETRKLDLKLHRHIVAASGNDCLLDAYVKVQGQFMTANHLLMNHSDALQSMASNEHFKVLEYLGKYDYKNASKTLEHHIMTGCLRVVNRIEESVYSPALDE